MDIYYRLGLDDYSTPAYVSVSKSYYGTRQDIAGFLAAVEGDESLRSSFDSLISSLRADTDCQGPSPLTPMQTLFEERHVIEDYAWTHLNTWGFPYQMHCDRAETQHLWLRKGNRFLRCVKARLYGLAYEGEGGLCAIGAMLWGFPHVLEWEPPTLYTRLAETEKLFETEAEARADYDAFLRLPDPVFIELCNDIFGDG